MFNNCLFDKKKGIFEIQPKTITYAAVCFYLVFALLPVALLFGNALIIDGEHSLALFMAPFFDLRQLVLLLKSVLIAFFASFSALLMGVPLGLFICRSNFRLARIFKLLYLVPICIPPYIQALCWLNFFSSNYQVSFSNHFSMVTASLFLGLSFYPFVTLLAISGFNSIDHRLEESALLSRNKVNAFFNVTLPLIRPYVISGGIFVFIFSLLNYGVPALVGVNTFPVEIFAQFSAFYNEKAAVALSFPLILISLSLLFLQKKMMGERSYITIDTGYYKSGLYLPKKVSIWLAAYSSLIICFSVVIPLSLLIIQSGGIESFIVALKSSHREITNSFIIALVSSIIIVVVGLYFTKGVMSIKSRKVKNIIDALTFLPFAFPAMVVGISLIYFWNRSHIAFVYQSAGILILAYFVRFVPFVIRIFSSNFRQINVSLTEAAVLIEKRWIKRHWDIEIPLYSDGIGICLITVFVMCMGELGATLLLIPPGYGTNAIKIYTIMHYGSAKLSAALSLILIGTNFFVAMGILAWMKMKKAKWN